MDDCKGITRMIKALSALNPGIRFNHEGPHLILTSCQDAKNLSLPKGYYLCGQNELTNKHNTRSGVYESFTIMSTFEYLVQFV